MKIEEVRAYKCGNILFDSELQARTHAVLAFAEATAKTRGIRVEGWNISIQAIAHGQDRDLAILGKDVIDFARSLER